jgi:cellulose synthase/poly-beta-1,6-N-acetylglucosamine synthase-like glycosyltransferase
MTVAERRPYRAAALGWIGGLLLLGGVLGLDRLLFLVTVGLACAFLMFFVRHLAFAISAMRIAPNDLKGAGVPVSDRELPTVSVVVACRDEISVVADLVGHLRALDYPERSIEFVIVDDGSVDGTGEWLDVASASIPNLTALHRPRDAGGGKSGALNHALALLRGEIVVIFDADHRPREDVVVRLVRHFRDPAVAAVQGRCEIGNVNDSLLTQVVWLDYLAGYLVNEYGRQLLFQLPAYGGANCAVRASSLRAVGGWNPRSVTEDTDLTIRLLLRGERVRYDVTAVDEEEGVVTLGRYWRQRYRWARGHQQVCRDYRMAVWRSDRLSLPAKAELTMFLYAFHLPVLSALGVVVFMAWMLGSPISLADTHLFVFWTLLFLGPLLELGGGLLIARASPRAALLLVFFVPIFFLSIMLCTKAWIDGVAGRPYAWAKTARRQDAEVVA